MFPYKFVDFLALAILGPLTLVGLIVGVIGGINLLATLSGGAIVGVAMWVVLGGAFLISMFGRTIERRFERNKR